jgi:hypothetical protein
MSVSTSTAPDAGAAPGPSSAVPSRLTRDQVLGLGRSASPWVFVPVALRALQVAPDDDAVRFLLAAHYARLHLRTAAAEQIEHLSPAARRDPGVAALAALVAQLPDDRLPADHRRRWGHDNLQVLVVRGCQPSLTTESLDAWRDRLAGEEAFRACDGNIVRRAADGRGAPWIRFADDAGAARSLALPPPGPDGRCGPWVVEGLDPPWFLQRVCRGSPRQADGYWPRVTLVQADAGEFLDGLSLADLRAELAEERLRVFVGPSAASDLAADLDRRADTMIDGPSLVAAGVRRPVRPPIDRVIRDACGRQAQEECHLRQAVAEVYDGRDRAWWARRWAEAGAGASGPDPLRVLIPTCRYSTFVRHAAADLARAMEAAGCRTRVLIEPDASSLLSTVAYLREMLDFQPDLVVLINYTRANLAGAIHPGVPCVCWIQDAMPHLFDEAVGRAQGPLDFVAGHLHAALFERFGFPADRAVPLPVTASAEKFHPGPVDPALRRRLECEVAMASHHSQTPAALHARLGAEAAATPAVPRIFERLFPRVVALAEESASRPLLAGLRDAVAAAARETLGRDGDDRLLALLLNQYALPIADRAIRHQALAWAAAVCRRRGWRLRIHGRGWEAHPTLAEFAAGELAHGEELRASYRSAAVHLHASANWVYHQRVMECALSGGLPLCRRKEDDLGLLWLHAANGAVRSSTPYCCRLDGRRTACYRVVDSPDLLRYHSLLQRLGHPHARTPVVALDPPTIDANRRWWAPIGFDTDGAWLLGDPAQVTFATEAELERAVERALASPRWRADVSGGIASRVRRRFTHDAAAGAILDLVRRGLGPAPERGGGAGAPRAT